VQTTITIPNPVYEAAEHLAQKLDLSLSELYAIALTAYMTSYDDDEITAVLDRIYANEPSAMDTGMLHLQLASVGDEKW
jgi:hypothetical protein